MNEDCEEGEDWCRPGTSKGRQSNSDCIIHCSSDNGKLINLTQLDQWNSLMEAARINRHGVLLELEERKECPFPKDIYYHKNCRSAFVLKAKRTTKESEKGETLPLSNSDENIAGIRRTKRKSGVTDILMPTTCIFCQKLYKKVSYTKENTIKCQEKNAVISIQAAQERKQWGHVSHILANHDLLANQAHYHPSCYRSFTKIPRESVIQSINKEVIAEKTAALDQLYDYIRSEIIEKKKVETMVNVIEKYSLYLGERGLAADISKWEKHKLRESLKVHFEETLTIFQIDKTKLLLIPKNISIVDIAIENYYLKEKLISRKRSEKAEDRVLDAARLLREEIIDSKPTFSWPPQPAELNGENIDVPPLTHHFFNNLISGRSLHSDVNSIKIKSFYQDVSYAINRNPSSKHILLPFAIKVLTGNVEVIKILNRLGHGISYSRVLEIDTAFAIQKLTADTETVLLPDQVQKGLPTSLVYDNIDRLEETLTGSGTSHRVNGIAVQEGFIGPLLQNPKQGIPKTKRRSFEFTPCILLPYISGQRPQPPVLPTTRLESEEEKTERIIASKKDLLWVTTRIRKNLDKTVPSWTGFNIVVRKDKMRIKDRVGYLPSIDSPASSMATIHEMLVQAIKIKEELELSGIVLVCDQAIYAKAVEISWKHCDEFKPIVLRLGSFHTACTYMAVIGKRFKDAGLRDIAIESGIVADGSLNRVIEGKEYNRCMRTHKLLYEAFMRLIWKGFLNWISEEIDVENKEIDSLNAQTEDLCQRFLPDMYNKILEDKSFLIVYELFQRYCQELRYKHGNMCAFWMSYITMVEVLLNLTRASREGNWLLHLASIRAIIPWVFAYDHTNYARYLPWYLINMQNLENSHPEIYQYLNDGGFSVQLSSENPFGKIPMDQTIEETINKDTQTPGGTKGFSLNHGAVARYYITADEKKECLRLLRDMVNSSVTSVHHDLQKSRIERDEDDVKKVLQMFETTWKNPFEEQDLANISTGMLATPDVVNDLLNTYEKGKTAYRQFIDSRLDSKRTLSFFDPLHRLKLKTFGSMNVKTVNVKGKEVVLTVDRNLFAKMAVIAQSRNLNMKEVLQYELGPFPWSIATCDGSLRKTNKATLSNNLEKASLQVERVTENSSTIIDAMAVIQKIVGNFNGKTFSDIAKFIFHKILSEGKMSNRIDVVFDTYNDISIKSIERSRRGAQNSVTFDHLLPGHKIKQCDKFLKSSANKMALIRFLADEWKKEDYRNFLVNKSLFISCEGKCWRLTKDDIKGVSELNSDQEEADTRILLHAKHAYDEGCSEILIVSEDTDVHVLGVSFSTEIPAIIHQKRGTQTKSRIINLSFIKDVLSTGVALALPGLHAFTGCDSVSAFSGKGKLSALKLVKRSKEYQNAFKQLGDSLEVPENLEKTLEKFVCELYGGKTSDISDLRYLMFCAKSGDIGSNQLPPSRQSLHMHILRASYQAYIWKNSLVAQQGIESPIGYGWKLEDGQLVIDWGYNKAAPDEILEFMACQCKKGCTIEGCCCASNHLPCTDMCKCKTCDNRNDDFVEEGESVDIDEDEDEF